MTLKAEEELEEDALSGGHERIHWAMGIPIFINALVGVGLLNFPASIHAAGGLPTALFLQSVLGFRAFPCLKSGGKRIEILVSLLFSSVCLMVWCADQKKCVLYQEVVEVFLGSVCYHQFVPPSL